MDSVSGVHMVDREDGAVLHTHTVPCVHPPNDKQVDSYFQLIFEAQNVLIILEKEKEHTGDFFQWAFSSVLKM